MASMTSLGTALSGLAAAQAGLYVTGHNMANVDTKGYTRQRVMQNEFLLTTIGYSGQGAMQIGLGTDIEGIRQIRNKFLDLSYREEAGKAGFYNAKADAGQEIEMIFGELQSDYRTQSVIEDLWASLNELSTYQPGLDTRGNFISTCITFIDKANNVFDRLYDYQHNIDEQIRDTVNQINTLVEKVGKLNTEIKFVESSGDSANDYRDQRNDALDELSKLANVEVKQNKDGTVTLLLEGNELLANGSIRKLGLKYTSSDYKLVEPVFTSETEILPYNAPLSTYQNVYTLTGSVNSALGNDRGLLKGLMVAKGYSPCNYKSPVAPDVNALDSSGRNMYTGEDDPAYKLQMAKNQFDAEHSMIPKFMRQFDTIVNGIVTMINDAVSPKTAVDPSDPSLGYVKDTDGAPYGLDGTQTFVEIFVRKNVERFTDGDFNEENGSNPKSLYSIGNIEINRILLDAGGYNKIALSSSGDLEDTGIVLDLMSKWHEQFISIDGNNPLSINDSYRKLTEGIASETSEAINYAQEQAVLVTQVENKRFAMSGVSLDDEMTNMMKFQHAYNAAARIVNAIDDMMDRIVNGLAR